MYHEFVYLSDEKVRQFVPIEAAWWRGLRAKKIGAGLGMTPVEASLEVEMAEVAGDDRKLPRLIRYLEESARYYTEPDLIPGEWVMFDGRIGIAHLDAPPAVGAVLFCEAAPITVETPRIILHGSARHFRPGTALDADTSTVRQAGGYSLPSGLAPILESANRAGRGRQHLGMLREVFNRSTTPDSDLNVNLTKYFHDVACSGEYLDVAPYLGGLARVTAVVDPPRLPFPVVVASPLFVRYERP
ncbi:SAVMC3_10250 family protein [Kribbella sp. NPDC000426]|uniref:SAVMC3_10250 family protein n=1 Tax=Kribbella sp. NPDC000426 TaxID=3154255 RepID=UPI003329F120